VCFHGTRRSTPCGHSLCRFCWRRLQNLSCPLCRQALAPLAPPRTNPRDLLAPISRARTFAEVERLADALPEDAGDKDAALARASLLRRAAQLLEAQSLKGLCAHSRVVLWLLSLGDESLRQTVEAKLWRTLAEAGGPQDLLLVARAARIAASERGVGKAAAAALTAAFERVLAGLAASDLREATPVLSHMAAVTKAFPAARRLVTQHVRRLAAASKSMPAASAGPAVQDIFRAVAALLRAGVLEEEELPDDLTACLALRLHEVLASLGSPEASASYLQWCTASAPGASEPAPALGGKLGRALEQAAERWCQDSDTPMSSASRSVAVHNSSSLSVGDLPPLVASPSNLSIGRSRRLSRSATLLRRSSYA